MTAPYAPVPAPARRRVRGWVIALAVLGGLALAGLALVGLLSAGIVSYGVDSAGSASDRDLALQDRDPIGGTACNYLDMLQAGGIGSWADVSAQATLATTDGIRVAATDQTALDAACRAAGANMSPR